ncbi:HNH endonuclease [Flavobacterium yafengii]|uniref:HNH endonuclease n=1 Tax=Flavobacterium yafengii TaxID=3041253 RepID=UPI0024A9EEB6|nr:HNH endonuclease [Flavobacterium yafengii]MDI5886243.1 HNH endonuclease [Flavobacterium yafengii]
MKCIFCDNNLDNSDEHIILNSLNGKLHSKEIICSECNNFFGSHLDNVAKKFFNTILLVFQFKNASGEIAENLKGEDKFLFQKNLTPKQVKLDISEFKSQGKRLVSVSGNPKDAMKKFEKLTKTLEDTGSKIIAKSIQESTKGVPLRIKVDFKTNSEINILLNKIALEYCHYIKMTDLNTKDLALKVRVLDKTLSNVFYCNLTEEIRKFSNGEITHCIFLKKIENKLIVYIELFNVICSVIVIDDNYVGEDIEHQYYQNAITGEKMDSDLGINLNEIKKLVESKPESIVDFNPLANKLFLRKRDKDFSDKIDFELNSIANRLQNELKNKQITQKQFAEKYIDETTEMIAELSIENPYLMDDVDDANNDELNYYHSNIRAEQFEEFSNQYKHLIGKKVNYENDKTYLIEEFSQAPIAEQNGIKINRLYICLFNGFNRIHIPYREFFEGISVK